MKERPMDEIQWGFPINVHTPTPVNAAVTTQADHAPLSVAPKPRS